VPNTPRFELKDKGWSGLGRGVGSSVTVVAETEIEPDCVEQERRGGGEGLLPCNISWVKMNRGKSERDTVDIVPTYLLRITKDGGYLEITFHRNKRGIFFKKDFSQKG
jgi:hypothetical protein